MTSGQFGALLSHIDLKLIDQHPAQLLANSPSFLDALAIDGPLDVEQGIDAAHDLDCDSLN